MAIKNSHCLIKAKEIEPLQFFISDCPQENELPAYIALLKSNNAGHLIRLSQPTYDASKLEEAGISVSEFYFEDGNVPPPELIKRYFELIDKLKANPTTIAIHCVSGMGRAPLLVCCALVRGGMDRLDAVDFIRKHRRGAINKTQLNWLSDSKKGFKIPSAEGFFKKLLKKK